MTTQLLLQIWLSVLHVQLVSVHFIPYNFVFISTLNVPELQFLSICYSPVTVCQSYQMTMMHSN